MHAKVTHSKIYSGKTLKLPSRITPTTFLRGQSVTSTQLHILKPISSSCNAFKLLHVQKRTLFSDISKTQTKNQSIKQLNESDKLLIADCIEMAMQYDSQQKYEDALKMFDQALLLDPTNADVNFCKGIIYSKMQKYPEAIDSFKSSISSSSSPSNILRSQALLNIGFCFSQIQMYEESVQFYNQALKEDPLNEPLLVQKGATQIKMKEYQEAISNFETALQQSPNNVKAIFHKGVALGGLGKHEEAIKCYDEVIALNSSFSSQAWFNKGAALGLLYRFEEAVSAFDEVLKLDKNNAGAYFNKGTFLIELNRGEEATKCFEQASNLDPSITSPYKKVEDV